MGVLCVRYIVENWGAVPISDGGDNVIGVVAILEVRHAVSQFVANATQHFTHYPRLHVLYSYMV